MLLKQTFYFAHAYFSFILLYTPVTLAQGLLPGLPRHGGWLCYREKSMIYTNNVGAGAATW